MEELEIYQEYEKIRRKWKLPETVKPCLMLLLDNKEKLTGDIPFILASELNRVGKEAKRIEKILDSLYISQSKTNSILKSLKAKDYKFDCSTLEDRGFCLFKDHKDCWWWKKSPDKKEWEEKDFYRYGWPKKLKLTEERLYTTLRTIEIKRGWPAGSRLFISWIELHQESGVARGIIGKRLESLKKKGLIKHIPGDYRRKGSKGRATQVTRILPIPKPSNS